MRKPEDGQVTLSLEGKVANILFERPQARNAMSPPMYDDLLEHCQSLKAEDGIRVAVLRGAGGRSFVAGSDIAQFTHFSTSEDGVDYENKMEAYLEALSSLPFPTVAVIEGFAVGGGLNIAACCDIRIATRGSRLGAPIGRTIGNCLSFHNYMRLVAGFGEGRARRMMLLGELLDAEEAAAAGFLGKVCDEAELDEAIQDLCSRILKNAPLSLRASKVAINEVISGGGGDFESMIRLCYGSDDFKEGVNAFLAKRHPVWLGH